MIKNHYFMRMIKMSKFVFSESNIPSKQQIIIPRDANMDGTYWGFLEGNGPIRNENKIDGQCIYNGQFLAQFENAEQAVISLLYSRYSYEQIMSIVPKYNIGYVKLGKLIENNCSVKNRKMFIDNLRLAFPRHMFDNEFNNIKMWIGPPKGKMKAEKIKAIRQAINLHLEENLVDEKAEGKKERLLQRREIIEDKIEKLNTEYRNICIELDELNRNL